MNKSTIRRCLILITTLFAACASSAWAADTFVYFGSHGKGSGYGFSLAHFDTDTGRLTAPEFLLEAVAPAYFIISPDKKHLYTCNSAPGSSVSAYVIDPATAKLTFINQKPSDAVVFSIDANTGRLTQVGEPVKVLAPFCERFLPVSQ